MLLGFKRQFAKYVEEGSKTHTIRAVRKITPKVGEVCHCYVDPRQKSMRLLGRFRCTRVSDIEICRMHTALAVFIDGEVLSCDEAESLFQRDGFRAEGSAAITQAAKFWKGKLPFKGHLIHWKYEKGAGL